jgi:hypothetical protein
MTRTHLVAIALVCHAVLVGIIGALDSPNRTELGHMAATAYFWQTGRSDVFCVNPPLTRIVSGPFIKCCAPNYNWNQYSPRAADRCEWALGTAFVRANSRKTVWWCFALARWSLIPLLLLGGYFGHRLSEELYGQSAGIIFLVLWCSDL